MSKVMLSVVTEKFTLIALAVIVSAYEIIYQVRQRIKRAKKENIYLLSVRLIDAADRCTTFDELDAVKAEFFKTFRNYGAHEDFKDCQITVRSAIEKKCSELHENNFHNGSI